MIWLYIIGSWLMVDAIFVLLLWRSANLKEAKANGQDEHLFNRAENW